MSRTFPWKSIQSPHHRGGGKHLTAAPPLHSGTAATRIFGRHAFSGNYRLSIEYITWALIQGEKMRESFMFRCFRGETVEVGKHMHVFIVGNRKVQSLWRPRILRFHVNRMDSVLDVVGYYQLWFQCQWTLVIFYHSLYSGFQRTCVLNTVPATTLME